MKIKLFDVVTCHGNFSYDNGKKLDSFYQVVGRKKMSDEFCENYGGLFQLQDIKDNGLHDAFGCAIKVWKPVEDSPNSKTGGSEKTPTNTTKAEISCDDINRFDSFVKRLGNDRELILWNKLYKKLSALC